MSHQVVSVRRETVAPCMTCLLCHKLLRDATTIIECLHTFCRKCIYRKLSDEELECCPVCNIDLGVAPLEKLRPDHNLEDIRAKIFPSKRLKGKAPEIVTPVALPAKRKERSLSSLVVNAPKVSSNSGRTGRRSKSIARKASKGSSFTVEKPITIEDDDTSEEQPEGSSSPEVLRKYAQSARQKSAAREPSNRNSPDKGRENGSEAWGGKDDIWKPLTCLVEAANRSKPSKFGTQGSVEDQHSYDNEGLPSKTKIRGTRQKSKLKDEKYCRENTPPESERPKKMRKVRGKQVGELRVSPQDVLDASDVKVDRRNYPIWFSLVASDEVERDEVPLPQIPASYLRIKDGSIPVSFIQKYLKMKLDLTSENEVEIRCMGQPVTPTLTLSSLIELWLETSTSERVSTTIGSSAKDFIMVLGYARRVPNS